MVSSPMMKIIGGYMMSYYGSFALTDDLPNDPSSTRLLCLLSLGSKHTAKDLEVGFSPSYGSYIKENRKGALEELLPQKECFVYTKHSDILISVEHIPNLYAEVMKSYPIRFRNHERIA